MLILIKGAGDLATGIACRLYRSGFDIVMTEIAKPTTVRCTVAFSRAIYEGTAVVEDIPARRADTPEQIRQALAQHEVAVAVDPDCALLPALRPRGLVDAILAKYNTGTKLTDAPIVIGVGPGFTAGIDCHAAVETQRGHNLGRAIYEGSPAPNTGVPGIIAGVGLGRLIRATDNGIFRPVCTIGDSVKAGQVVAYAGETAVTAQIDGTLRGLLPMGTEVFPGMKAGDVDPRDCYEYCFTVSDKARAIGGGVLEALLHFTAYPYTK